MHHTIKHHPLLDMSQPFAGILLDAYGVFWAGNAAGAIPGAPEAMKALVASGKIVGILSNATRLAEVEIKKLDSHGIHLGEHFHFLITSGEIARQTALSNSLPFSPSTNKYFVLGGPYPDCGIHAEIFAGSPFSETTDLSHAGFIYASTPQIQGEDQTDPKVFEPHVQSCLSSNLPMLCANPDLFAHEGYPPKAVVRQGSLARRYEELGGPVHYIGKPYSPAFAKAMQEFAKYSIHNPSDILMIGDTPETDVRGARLFGMSSALITQTGIMADRLEALHPTESVSALLSDDHPHFFLERLSL
ncbi:MAG: TIGR01459 family HAD-type hydrolase [Chlamydiae bacterium]|nr:TIGR01459 family HAD-type hydrolase [Chlamydiota bacterium]